MTTTLITAVGSSSAPAALESLRRLGHRVIGCDIYPKAWNLVSNQVDSFFQSVLATDAESYIQQLLTMAETEKIDLIIPLTDVEVDALCSQTAAFEEKGCKICIPPKEAALLCRDKLRMAQFLSEKGVCQTIPTFSPYGYTPKKEEFPLMLKPLHGRSSQAQAVVSSQEAFASVLKNREDYICQPFIDGKIYTVDAARDAFGNVQALTRCELLRTVNGLGTTVEILPKHPLEKTACAIADAVGLIGAVNMEFIGNDDGFWFLEVNPRFSGGIGFSCLAGMDVPMLHLFAHQGRTLPDKQDISPATMVRQIAPVITETH